MKLMEFLQRLKTKHFIVILFLIGFVVYLNVLPNGFVWDDEEQVVNNLMIQSFSNLPQIFKGSTFQTGGAGGLSGIYYKPLMTLSFMFNYGIWKLNAFGYHLFQVLTHLTNGVLVFLLLKNLFGKIKDGQIWAFLASLIFIVHPANIEAAGYISATQDVLYVFFALLALNFIFWKFKKPGVEGLILGFLLFFSLLSKEAGIVILPIGVLLCFWFVKEKLMIWLISGIGAFLGYFLLRFGIAQVFLGSSSVVPMGQASLVERLMSVPYMFFSYLRIFFFPKDLFTAQHLVIQEMGDYRFWLYLLIVLGFILGLAFIALRTKSKLFAFFIFWFLLAIGLVLNVFPLDMTLAERWFYLPMIGLLGTMVLLLSWGMKKMKWLERIILPVFLIIALLLSFRTIVRANDWRNGLTLFSHDIQFTPDSFDLNNNLGVELFRAGKIKEAKPYFERSIELEPKWWTPYNNLGVFYEREGDLGKAREFYEQAVENGNYYLAHENLAFIVLKEEEPEEAIKIINQSLTVLPYNLRLWTALTLVYYKGEQFEKAEELARKLYASSPNNQTRGLLEAILNRKEIEF